MREADAAAPAITIRRLGGLPRRSANRGVFHTCPKISAPAATRAIIMTGI